MARFGAWSGGVLTAEYEYKWWTKSRVEMGIEELPTIAGGEFLGTEPVLR